MMRRRTRVRGSIGPVDSQPMDRGIKRPRDCIGAMIWGNEERVNHENLLGEPGGGLYLHREVGLLGAYGVCWSLGLVFASHSYCVLLHVSLASQVRVTCEGGRFACFVFR